MLGELGQFLLVLGLVLSLWQGVLSFYGVVRGEDVYMRVGMWSLFGQTVCVVFAMGVLVVAFVVNDLSLAVVVNHSHALQPLFYRVTGVWGNHEGSLLMWNMMLSFWSACVVFRGKIPERVRGYLCCFLGFFSLLMLSLLTLTSSPFERLLPAGLYGGGLNPILQDPTLAIHPPMLYLGYVGLSVVCIYMMALLVSGGLGEKEWQERVWGVFHMQTMLSWVFLTGGIALGSAWAYHELGWGGFWFWDPVENTSLMPWLMATAIIHAGNVARRTREHQLWIVVLTLCAFLLSLLGTFLVRSGLLVSPHSFASDPTRGVALLMMLGVVSFGGLFMVWRYGGGLVVVLPSRFWSRENMMFTGSMVLASLCGGVAVGTLAPIVVEVVSGDVITIGHPYYHTLLVPMFFLLLVLVGLAPLMKWRKDGVLETCKRVRLAIGGGVVTVFVGTFVFGEVLASVSYGFSVWLFLSLVETVRRQGRRVSGGMVSAHLGLCMMAIAITSMTLFDEVRSVRMDEGEEIMFGGDRIVFEGVERRVKDNYSETRAKLLVVREEGESFMMYPSRRFYGVSNRETVEPDVRTRVWGDMHAVLGEEVEEGRWVMRFYKKPLVVWLWIGALSMVCGGIFSTFMRWKRRER